MRERLVKGLATGVLILATLAGGQSAKADSLTNVLSDAYLNSDLLEQNRYLLRLQDESVAQQVAGLRPVVNFIASRRWDIPANTITDTLTLTGELLLYDAGGRRFLRDAAQESVLATRQGLVNLEQQVLLDAVTAYLQVWRDMQIVSVRESNVRVITRQLRAAEDRFEVGEDTRTDVAQAQAALAGARQQLVSAQGTLMISAELFSLAVGRHPNGLSGPGAIPSLPQTEAEAEAIGRQNHPSIVALQHEVRADELSVQAARSDYRPSITLNGTTNYNPHRDTGNSVISLQLVQPLYAGGRLASAERIALATLHAAQAQLNQTTRVVSQNIGNAFAQIRVAAASISASQQQIRANRLAFEGVQEEASLGARTTLDVLNAEQNLLNARIGLIEAQAQLYSASYGLMAAMGLLTVEHLDLDVPQYDPTEYYNAVSTGPGRVPTRRGEQLDAILERLGRE